MPQELTISDWERILHALSQFMHHPDYVATHEKVEAIVECMYEEND